MYAVFSGHHLPHLSAVAVLLQSLAQAPGTWSNKNAHMKSFLSFCEDYRCQVWPSTSDTLVLYVTFLAVVRGLAVPTIRNHLASIRTFFSTHGLAVPSPTESQPLHLALRGASRFLSRPQQQKFPVTAEICRRLLAAHTFFSPFRPLFLLLFLTSLRLSSVLPTTATFNPAEHLAWGCVVFVPGHSVRLTIMKTKTIQCAERSLKFVVPVSRHHSVCLAAHLLALQTNPGYPRGPQDPIFSVWSGSVWVPLSRATADPTFKATLVRLGLRPGLFGWSSFRRGSATEYLLATGNTELLWLHSDWSTSVYQRYLAIPADRRSQVVTTLQGLLSEDSVT